METARQPDVTVLSAGPSLTMDNAHELIKLIRSVQSTDAPNIVIDMNQTHVMDSAGVGALVSSMRYIRQVRGSFAVAQLAPELDHMFRIMNLTQILNVFDSVQSASEYLAHKR